MLRLLKCFSKSWIFKILALIIYFSCCTAFLLPPNNFHSQFNGRARVKSGPSKYMMKSELGEGIYGIFKDLASTLQLKPGFSQWFRPVDNRPDKIKFLDTCLALVSEESMASWLERQANVDLSKWSRGQAKGVSDLLQEVLKGESQLRSDGCRVVRVAKVRIFDGEYELINTLQVLTNGAVKERNTHLSEKFGPNESPTEAASRGILEELGSMVGASARIRFLTGAIRSWEEEEQSTSYPGLRCIYQLHQLEVRIEGLTMARTGASFTTAEAAHTDGHSDKLHVWEWRQTDAFAHGASAASAAAAPAPVPSADASSALSAPSAPPMSQLSALFSSLALPLAAATTCVCPVP